MIQISEDMWINPKKVIHVYHCQKDKPKTDEWRAFTSDKEEVSWFVVKEPYLHNFLSDMGIIQ